MRPLYLLLFRFFLVFLLFQAYSFAQDFNSNMLGNWKIDKNFNDATSNANPGPSKQAASPMD